MTIKLTPAMRQYLEIKERHKDAIVFFRMGDFYEMFFEDARLCSNVLGIALTSRDREKKIPMCGVPYHAVTGYLSKLIKAGHKVAVCEQIEESNETESTKTGGEPESKKSAKTVMRREVSRVVTAGTALDDDLLESKANNFICAVCIDEKGKAGKKDSAIAFMDVTTGEFRLTELRGHSGLSAMTASLIDEVLRIAPTELILPEVASGSGSGLETLKKQISNTTRLDSHDFKYQIAEKRLLEHFSTNSLDGFGLNGFKQGVRAAGALLHYVKENQRSELGHVKKLTPYYPDNFLIIDNTTRKNLEVLQNSRDGGRAGTLLELLDRTRTSMGARLLSRWLAFPLIEKEAINKRLDAVAELVDKRSDRAGIREALRSVQDIERITGKISTGVAGPKDLVSLAISLKAVESLKGLMSGVDDSIKSGQRRKFYSFMLNEIARDIDPVRDASGLIENSISPTAPSIIRDGGFIKKGFSEELDELRSIGSGGKEHLSTLEQRERKATGITTLKVGYNRVFGYYLECTRANAHAVPDTYIRKQTLVNAERFITPELKEWEEKILTSQDTARELELRLFHELTERLKPHIPAIQATAACVARLDVACSFATLAEDLNYAKPTVTDGELIDIKDGRHPVIERSVKGSGGEEFVPNDLRLDSEQCQIMLLTGPNMAGKSTYIRQLALIVLMAQIGCFVPARSAEIGIVDKIFTRVGATDDLSRGHSTFMVEMNETANILHNATPRSLVILDEIGRGTATFDGLSIAWAVVEYLHDSPGTRAKTLFATHYHELTELSLTKERVKNYNMVVTELDDSIVFLRRILPGGADRSYGIHVAKLAGLPAKVIERAGEVLKNLETGELTEEGLPRIARGGKILSAMVNDSDDGATLPQLNIPGLMGGRGGGSSANTANSGVGQSTGNEPVIKELEKIDPDNLTPIEAINALNRIKAMIE